MHDVGTADMTNLKFALKYVVHADKFQQLNKISSKNPEVRPRLKNGADTEMDGD